jgi:hypothetical protein
LFALTSEHEQGSPIRHVGFEALGSQDAGCVSAASPDASASSKALIGSELAQAKTKAQGKTKAMVDDRRIMKAPRTVWHSWRNSNDSSPKKQASCRRACAPEGRNRGHV